MGVMRDGELCGGVVERRADRGSLTLVDLMPQEHPAIGVVLSQRYAPFLFVFLFGGFSRAESPEAGGACPWQPPVEFQCTPAAGPAQSCRLVGRSHLI